MNRRKAFSILEILSVVAIIAILLGLLFFGLKQLQESGREKATGQSLSNARGLLASYDAVNKVKNLWGGQAGTVGAITAPGNVTEDGPDRYSSAVAKTRDIMATLQAVPENKTALQQIPREQILKEQNAGDAPVLLDGWRNPIIYVPADGLVVHLNGQTTTIQSPDKRPFFVSAGPDGNFDKGDDNIYSFKL